MMFGVAMADCVLPQSWLPEWSLDRQKGLNIAIMFGFSFLGAQVADLWAKSERKQP